jgi:hypothetical protein
MKRLYIIFFICGIVAMLGQWVMNLGYIPEGKIITVVFGIIAMIVGFYCFIASIRGKYFRPPE